MNNRTTAQPHNRANGNSIPRGGHGGVLHGGNGSGG